MYVENTLRILFKFSCLRSMLVRKSKDFFSRNINFRVCINLNNEILKFVFSTAKHNVKSEDINET